LPRHRLRHRYRWSTWIGIVLALALLAFPSLAVAQPSAGPGSQPSPSQPETGRDARTERKPKKPPKPPKPKVGEYTPSAGVMFNQPLSADRRRIVRHLERSIRSVPPRGKIRIFSWNIRDTQIFDALIDAHRRGVSVQVIIWQGNSSDEVPNPGFRRMKEAFARSGNPKRAVALRSWTVKCVGSCRGRGGFAHTKFFLFSRAHKARYISMYGSANATTFAATRQWNDMYTIVGRRDVYRDFAGVFREAARDRLAVPPYRQFSYNEGRTTIGFLPWGGARKGDPVLRELNRIRCKGATGGTGVNGRTRIRIAQTAILDARGIKIAKRLKRMWDRGCDIKIVYALLGNRARAELNARGGRGPVPFRQIVQDFNADGIYDRYLHLKAMTVSGIYNGDTSREVTFNGSHNWTGMSMASDEVTGRIFGAGVRKLYSAEIDRIWNNPPPPSMTVGRGPVAKKKHVKYHGVELG
jgi:phosphatidylserine/phosphatidylglycerophosphate/cardiolipin synthase-like enzyme